MRISDHAVDRYIEREWGFPSKMAGDHARDIARRHIRKVLYDPDSIYYVEKERCPIYIADGVAVPFDNMTATSTLVSAPFEKKMDDMRQPVNDRGRA